jgi:hypothetical protein
MRVVLLVALLGLAGCGGRALEVVGNAGNLGAGDSGDKSFIGSDAAGSREEGDAADVEPTEDGPLEGGEGDSAVDGNPAMGPLDDCPLAAPSLDGGVESDAGCPGEITDAGRCLVTLATEQDNPTGLAVRGDTVVWGNGFAGNAGSIMRVGTNGGKPVTLASGFDTNGYGTIGVTLDDTYAYWASVNVSRVPLAGGPTEMLHYYGDVVLFPIRAGTNVYFVESQDSFGLFSVSTTGTAFTQLSQGIAEVAAVSSSSTGLVYSVYSTQEGTPGQLISLPCSSPPSTLYTDPSGTLGLVASAGDVVVFAQGSYAGGGNLMSIPLVGGTPSLLVSGIEADSLATDGAAVYWTDEGREAVMKLDLASGTMVALAPFDAVGSPFGENALALDATSVYWTTPCTGNCSGAVLKLTPR